MFNIGDLVVIVDKNKNYSTYYDWFVELGDIKLATRYAYNNSDLLKKYDENTKFKILARKKHYDTFLYAICPIPFDCSEVFLISEEGLEQLKPTIPVGTYVKIIDDYSIKPFKSKEWFEEHNLQHFASYYSFGNLHPANTISAYKVIAVVDDQYVIQHPAEIIFIIDEKGIKPVN